MNAKIIDILKYFLLTFSSLEIMYYIARSSFNLTLILAVSTVFTVLYALSKYKVIERLISQHNTDSKNTKKDQAF